MREKEGEGKERREQKTRKKGTYKKHGKGGELQEVMEEKGGEGMGKDTKKGRGGTGNGGQEERGKMDRWTGGERKGMEQREQNHGGDRSREGQMNKTSLGKRGEERKTSDVLLEITSQNHLQGRCRYCSLTSEALKFQTLQYPLLYVG